jgi:hypothetical protein
MAPLEQIAEREKPLIDRALEHWRKVSKGPLREYYKNNEEGMRNRVAVAILSFEEKLQRKEYSKLYSCIKEGGGDAVLEPVRMEYAIRLFYATLKEEPATALQAYDFIRVLDSSITYDALPSDVLEMGNSLFGKFAQAAAAYINWQVIVNPRAALNGLELTSPEKLKLFVPFLRF